MSRLNPFSGEPAEFQSTLGPDEFVQGLKNWFGEEIGPYHDGTSFVTCSVKGWVEGREFRFSVKKEGSRSLAPVAFRGKAEPAAGGCRITGAFKTSLWLPGFFVALVAAFLYGEMAGPAGGLFSPAARIDDVYLLVCGLVFFVTMSMGRAAGEQLRDFEITFLSQNLKARRIR